MFTMDDMQTQTLIESSTVYCGPNHGVAIRKILTKRSFCTLSTTSPQQRPHAAGVVYIWANNALWVHTLRSSRKGRNIAANDRVGICVAFRKLPVGPPFTIHFQASACLVDMQSSEALALVEAGELNAITELDMKDGCFVRITPRGTVHSFGPGARILDLIRNPLESGARSVPATAVLASSS